MPGAPQAQLQTEGVSQWHHIAHPSSTGRSRPGQYGHLLEFCRRGRIGRALRRKARVPWYVRVRAACLHAVNSMQTSQNSSMEGCAQLENSPSGLCRCKCTCSMLVPDDCAAA